MDCPGGHRRGHFTKPLYYASTLVLMDCPGGHQELWGGRLDPLASTLVLMDCPGGPVGLKNLKPLIRLQPLF